MVDEKTTPTPEEIYQAYPRHVGSRAAIAAIKRALKRIAKSPDCPTSAAWWLLIRVRAFAESPAGQQGTFTPHPATWFNAGRYDDDDIEWQRSSDPSRVQGDGEYDKL